MTTSMDESAVAAGVSRKDSTGTPGLDAVLCGGFTRSRMYLVEGAPGAGKTTLAMQYLIEGARRGESVLYVSLAESREEIDEIAASHGWSLAGVHVRELVASEASLRPDEQYTMFHPSEVELGETTRQILAEVDALEPTRVVFDSLSELRLLAGNALRYRRQIVALKQFFAGRRSTVIVLDDVTVQEGERHVHTVVHGIIRLEQLNPKYGAERRRLAVIKYRATQYLGGYHDFVIRRGGLEVFPRLRARDHADVSVKGAFGSGIPELDALLGGGLIPGTSTLIIGAAGTGKSSIAAQFAAASGARGDKVALFIFDENRTTLMARCAGLAIDLCRQIDAGHVTLQQVDPAELSPGEFSSAIQRAVENGAKLIVIDSLNGYLNAMPEERFLVIQLHEMLTYLNASGVVTILIGAHQGMIGTQMVAPIDASYLADTVLLLRYFEAGGEVRQALSVMKHRAGNHERTIREFKLQPGRISVGPALSNFRGVLTGVPVYDDAAERMRGSRNS